MEATDLVKENTFLSFLSSKLIVGGGIGPGIASKLSAGTGLQTCGELADAKLDAVAKMVVKGWPHVAELRDALRRRLRGEGGEGGEGGGREGGSGGGGEGGCGEG